MLSAVIVQATNYTDVDILNFALNLEVCLTTRIAHTWFNKLLLLMLLDCMSFLLICRGPTMSFLLICRGPTNTDLFIFLRVASRCLKAPICLLQCLEAEFYSWVAYGEGIYTVDSSLVGESKRSLALTER